MIILAIHSIHALNNIKPANEQSQIRAPLNAMSLILTVSDWTEGRSLWQVNLLTLLGENLQNWPILEFSSSPTWTLAQLRWISFRFMNSSILYLFMLIFCSVFSSYSDFVTLIFLQRACPCFVLMGELVERANCCKPLYYSSSHRMPLLHLSCDFFMKPNACVEFTDTHSHVHTDIHTASDTLGGSVSVSKLLH